MTLDDLRQQFPNCTTHQLGNWLSKMKAAREIVHGGYGRPYWVDETCKRPDATEPPPPPAAPPPAGDDDEPDERPFVSAVGKAETEATLRREKGPCSVFDVARAVSHSVGRDAAPEVTVAPAPPPALQWKPAAAPQPAPQVNDPDDAFVCALFSDGRLLVESGGRQLDLPLEHTRALLHYLDHLRGTELVSTLGVAA